MKGLLMTPENAQKCHDGTKTQTRRLIKGIALEWLQPGMFTPAFVSSPENGLSPYSIGEHVYIKEAHYRYGHWEDTGKLTKHGRVEYRFIPESDNVLYLENPPDSYLTSPNGYFNGTAWYKRPSLFLPADLARTVVEITNIRAQRVQDIDFFDARAEGILSFDRDNPDPTNGGMGYNRGAAGLPMRYNSTAAFMDLWNSIHGAAAWERNDWVWAYSFKKVEA